MSITETAIKNHDELWPDYKSRAMQTDPELIELFDNFAFDEVISYGNLDTKILVMMILGSTIACQAHGEYKMMVNAALNVGVTPIEVKEILYQSVPYVGISKVVDFIYLTNEIFTDRGITLPLEGQSTTTLETRYEKGLKVQKKSLKKQLIKMYEKSPKNQLHIQKYLSANCFGDYYTRKGLDIKTRELLTLSMLIALGGTEPQIKGGYPRTLNAIKCLNEVFPE